MTASHITLASLNAADQDVFVAAVGFVFEHSPWIAAEAWQRRPFATREQILSAMRAALDAAGAERKLALIQAHPDLAARVEARRSLTHASSREQASAGLDGLSPEDYARFTCLNDAYRARFGFPFVICVRDNTRASILEAFETRLSALREREISTALDEIVKIAGYRLADAVE